jgi:hypothetical protein
MAGNGRFKRLQLRADAQMAGAQNLHNGHDLGLAYIWRGHGYVF